MLSQRHIVLKNNLCSPPFKKKKIIVNKAICLSSPSAQLKQKFQSDWGVEKCKKIYVVLSVPLYRVKGCNLFGVNKVKLTLVHAPNGRVLSSNIGSSFRCVLYMVRHYNFFRAVVDWLPVCDDTHPWLSVTKLLTKLSILRVCATTAMRIMEANVQEELLAAKKGGVQKLSYVIL